MTAGHGGMVDTNDADCGVSHCGDVDGHNNDGDVDASFIKLRSGWLPSKSFMNGDSYNGVATSSYVVLGTVLSAYGSVSGKQIGEITATSFSTVIDGTLFFDLVQADYVAIHGDSGAAVTFWMYIGTGIYLRTVMGIHGKSSLSSTDEWMPGVSRTLFSRVDNIYDELDITTY